MLKELHAVLPATDILRARSFYQDTLGLEPDEEHPGSLMYHPTQGSAFEIYETGGAGTAETSQMGWLTDDLDSEMERLRARGVVFEKLDGTAGTTIGGVAHTEAKAAWFRDTEGNLLCITQLTSGRPPASKRQLAGSGRRRDPLWNVGLPPELLTGIPAV